MKLIVGNSYSQLQGLTSEQLTQIKKVLSYTDSPDTAHFSGAYKPHRKYLVDKRGFFPTGLLYLVKDVLKKTQWIHTLEDHRKRPDGRSLFRLSL